MDTLPVGRSARFLLGLLIATVSLAAAPTGESQDKAAIAKVIDDSIGWFATKDFDRLYGSLADDSEFFIYHPGSKSTIRGAEAFRKFSEFFSDPDLVYAGHEIRELSIDTSPAGDAAWFSALLDDCSEYKGEKSCWKDCRWTGVLEKRGDRWVIVQMHFSFAQDQVAAEAVTGERERAGLVFGSYDEMRGVVVDLFGQKRYAEAAAILAGAVPRYPDRVLANTFNLALMYASLGNREEAVRALEDGHRRGVFYGKWTFEGAHWDTLRAFDGFRSLLARNEELIAEAQKSSAMKLEVAVPEGYQPGRRYPLFIALHGGGENLAQFRPRWTSPRLRGQFIVAYVQSSQVAGMDGYHWQDDAITRRELEAAYREIVAKYSVDPSHVLLGGFSSGGYGTLVTLFEGTLPASGFVILCPEVPDDPSRAALDGAARRGIRGTLLTTEQDGRLKRQEEYVSGLAAHGLSVRFIVTPKTGHWYPDDLESKIDEALAHILSGS
jgi:acetyl esterase/lipase/ketosteroid isomerase-like protein